MTTSDDRWIPIRSRDLWDVPHAIHLRWRGVEALLDGPFDESLDDFAPDDRTLRLSKPPSDEGSWVRSIEGGIEIGRIPVASVRFDETRREFIERSSVESLLAALRI